LITQAFAASGMITKYTEIALLRRGLFTALPDR
jgi:hypothetical protein